jgi:RNA polymerase sigma-70 factor, ECF subfamily
VDKLMSFLAEVQLDDSFGPCSACHANLGFIPNLFRAQSLLPRVIEAEAMLESAILVKEAVLSRIRKEEILLTIAGAQRNTYCAAAHWMILRSLEVPESRLTGLLSDYRRAGLPAADLALLDFALKLTYCPLSVNSRDIEAVRQYGFNDESILETVLVTALTSYLSTLCTGLGPEPDFEPPKLAGPPLTALLRTDFQNSVPHVSGKKGPYLRAVYQNPKTFLPFLRVQESHGFIPNFFRAQTLRPDVIEAETDAVARILMPQDVLTRVQKECILLAVSAVNLNSYCVAVHCNMLRGLGMPAEEGDQIALDHHESCLSETDKALLDFALKLATSPSGFCGEDVDQLQSLGFNEKQILECVGVTALNNFSNTLQMGLGVEPDFEPHLVFKPNGTHPFAPAARPMSDASLRSRPVAGGEDPDAGLVAAVQDGSLAPFEELVRHHSRLVYRTLLGILGDADDAQDAMQEAFLNAFEHISEFQRRSKFSTWLLTIARNAAFQRLRDRKYVRSLDEGDRLGEDEFRPMQVCAWQDDPERLYSQREIRELVEKGVMSLPAKYRVVVVLRDIEQLSSDEAAASLGLSIPALKARLLRGRLMLREWLSPYFSERAIEINR